MSNFFLKLWVRGESAARRLRTQEGAETVQVIMIMGIMALLIGLLLAPGSPINDEIRDLANQVRDTIRDI